MINKIFSILFLILSTSFFAQAQPYKLKEYIAELEEKKDVINNSLCKGYHSEEMNAQYQQDLAFVKETYEAAILVYETPNHIPESAVIEKGEKSFTYKSKHNGLIIKRRAKYSEKMDDLFYEEFTYNNARVKVEYRTLKKKNYLVNIEMKFPNDIGVYYDCYQLPFSCKVYTKKEDDLIAYAPKRLILRYESHSPYMIREIMILEKGMDRYDWYIDYGQPSMRCFGDHGDEILPKKGTYEEIKPKVYLLWYEGTIGKYPIKLMLKTKYNEKYEEYRVEDVLYGYDSQKKWIEVQDLREPQGAILGDEKDKDGQITAHWDVAYEMNKELKGEWYKDFGESSPIPITLKPMAKEFPTFTFKAKLEATLNPRGAVVGDERIVRSIAVFKNNKKIQELKIEDGTPLEYLDFGYVDMNYDGYLDLIFSSSIYYYEPDIKQFRINDEEEYYQYLTTIEQYDLFNKSFIAQMNRSMIEYRAVDGNLLPYHASSYYPNEEGMVMLEEDYVNGKWVVVSEEVEKMIEDDEPVYDDDDDVDVFDAVNYALDVDLTVSDGALYFSPDFYNKTGIKLTFNDKAKLFVEVKDAGGNWQEQYLYEVPLNGEPEDMLDDNPIIWTGNEYLLFPGSGAGLIPFFPADLKDGDYTFRLRIENSLFGKVYSNESAISLPLGLKKTSTVLHFSGSINNVVNGDIYFSTSEKQGTFINAKTGEQILLKGEYVQGLFGVDELNLEEYNHGGDKLNGYFEGDIMKGVYKGFWLSPDKTSARVPFEFKIVNK